MQGLAKILAVIAACMVLEAALSVVRDTQDVQDEDPIWTFSDYMDSVTENIKKDVKRIRYEGEQGSAGAAGQRPLDDR